MKWGGVTKSGVSAMKKIVNEQKQKEETELRKLTKSLNPDSDDLTG